MSPSKLWVGWKPPRELDRPLPRPVRLTGGGILLYVLSAVLLAGGVMGAIWLDGKWRAQQAEARRMIDEGRQTEGAVTRLWRGGEDSEDYRVDYRFTVHGRDYDGYAIIGGEYWQRLHLLSPIPVRYLPSDPTHSYPSDDPPSPLPAWVPFLIGGIFAATGAWMPLKVRRQRRLLERGRPAPAVVRRLRKWRTTNETQNFIYYEFALAGGGVCKGRSSVNRKTMSAGSVICILYDPDDPRRNAAFPLFAVRLAAE
jgi:Protein of unknown function (DUF3592)